MKKLLTYVSLALVVALALPFAFVGCKKSNSLVGTWTFVGIEYEGTTAAEAAANGFVASQFTKDTMFSINFNKNGTGSISSKSGTTTVTTEITWKQNGEKVTITIESDDDVDSVYDREFLFKNGKLYFEVDSSDEEETNTYHIYATFQK